MFMLDLSAIGTVHGMALSNLQRDWSLESYSPRMLGFFYTCFARIIHLVISSEPLHCILFLSLSLSYKIFFFSLLKK